MILSTVDARNRRLRLTFSTHKFITKRYNFCVRLCFISNFLNCLNCAAAAIYLISSGILYFFLFLVAAVEALTSASAPSNLACGVSKPPSCPPSTQFRDSYGQRTNSWKLRFLSSDLGTHPALNSFHSIFRGPQPGLGQVPRRRLKIARWHNVINVFLSDTRTPGLPGMTFPTIISINPSTRHRAVKIFQ